MIENKGKFKKQFQSLNQLYLTMKSLKVFIIIIQIETLTAFLKLLSMLIEEIYQKDVNK